MDAMRKLLPHKHSLSLIDLNPTYPHDEVAYDDEKDLIITQAFKCSCDHCNEEITYLHKYFYKCDQCEYSLHKLCAELPTKLEHASHNAHTLTLFHDKSLGQCLLCKRIPLNIPLCYRCSQCMFNICLDCGMKKVQYHAIYHPIHQHPLIPVCKWRPILAKCDACGKEHKGVFYHCGTCFCSFIHSDCVFLPKRLLIQKGTHGPLIHTHPLTLAYSFPKVDQEAKYNPPCRVCDDPFSNNENLWLYKCEKCRYYAHVNCAVNPSSGTYSSIASEYNEDDPDVIRLPLPEQSYNITSEMSLINIIHEHPLKFVDRRCNDITVSITCNGCMFQIPEGTSFYKCTNEECNFALHDWCTRLPAEIKGHQGMPGHTLVLSSGKYFLGLLRCKVCYWKCNGFVYTCVRCAFVADVCCALVPKRVIHKSHPYHLLEQTYRRISKNHCRMCLSGFTYGDREVSLSCNRCSFHLHVGCAFLLPDMIRHRYDKHPMTLSYGPIQNHEGDYFCEVCEEELNPNISFYHCYDCVQSIHSACAPLVLAQSTPYIFQWLRR